MHRTGTDSMRMRCSTGSPARKAAIRMARATSDVSVAITGVTTRIWTRKVARNSDGRVTMSPAAVTSGAATLSMSQPRRTDWAATANVSPRTATEEITPPRIEITTKSAMEMVWPSPNPTATALASTARAREIDRVSDSEASTFWPTTVSRRRARLNSPV